MRCWNEPWVSLWFKMKWSVVITCLCFFVGVSANSLKDPYICGIPSCTPSEKFKYLPEIIYNYEYKVSVNTWFAGSSNNRSTLDVTATAELQLVTACEGLLQLSNVTLQDQDHNYPLERSEKFVLALTQHDLRFAFHDGLISEICPHALEEDWVLNFKRGLLSLFQNSMKRFDINFKGVERDIHGTCPVDYSVRGQENTSLVLIKSRNLAQCSDRYKYQSILQTVRYNFQSDYQTWPVLNSENKCRISIDHHIYKSVNCKERHLFEPFSGNSSGAMTTVEQNLVLAKEVNKTDMQIIESQPKTWSVITVRSNLLHHHMPNARPSTGELKSARDVLKLLCQVKEPSDDDPPPSVDDKLDSGSTVGLWGSLVRASRGLPHAALTQLLSRATAICARAKKHILDALPYIASEGSVQLIKDMILEHSVDQQTRDEWLMSMAMIPRPKIGMLNSMLELLKKEKYDKVVSFTVSSMVHSYCKHTKKGLRECCEEDIPRQIMEEFQGIVNEVIHDGVVNAPRAKKTNLIIAIKSLGNIGGFKQEFSDVLVNIISDVLIPVPIRLTGIDAFRKTPCEETREYFLEMYREDYVDIEVRLASYLQVMRCPNLSTIRKIFHALKHERVNQAATFVWSHLNNLGQSSLPSRVEIQGLLSGNTVPQLEDTPDFRMFSTNYEQGVFFDQYNAGGNYEANVIFSPDSYIPRSVSLNLTIDMFGESINLLELKGRGEGFERYFESIFGNDGPLNKNKVNDQVQEQIEKLRFYRSVDDADEVRRKVDDLGYKNEALKHQFPLAELGIKVFGNEISYWSAEGDEEIRQSLARLNPQVRLMEILSGKVISYNKASLFLDTTFSVGTGCGLPLNMHLMGTSYVNMNMSGTVVDRSSSRHHTDLRGKIHPSVALNIAATMGVIAGRLSSTGVRLNTRLYTATAVEIALTLRGFQMMKLDLSLPHSRQEIFAYKSELIILHGDKELQQQGLNKNRIEQNTCSWSTFDQAIGIKLCAAYQFPNMTNLRDAPYFLLSGPSKYILSLEKADPSAKTYAMQYTWDKNDTNNMFTFSFDTPNSKEKRIFNALVSLSPNSSTAEMTFQSAKNTLKAKAMYKNLEYDKCVEASLDIDGRKQFDTVMAVKRHDIKFGYVWVPRAYWIVNEQKIAELSGTLKVKSKGGVTQVDISAEFQTKQLASRLLGYYTINGPTHGTRLQLDYQFYKNPKQTIKIEGLYSERSMGFRHDVYGELAMDSTAYPVYNFYSVLSNIKSQTHLDIKFNVSASRALKHDPSFLFAYSRVDKLSGMKLGARVMLARPRAAHAEIHFEQIGPKYNANVLLNFNPKSRDIVVSGYMCYPPGAQLYVDAELNMTLPTLHPMAVKAKIHEKQPNEFQLNALGMWFTGVDFNIDALYQDQSKTNMASHRLKVLINSSHFKDIAVDARFTQDNRQITFIGQGEYNDGKYRTLLRYILLSEQNFTTYAEVDISGKAYSVNLNADMNNNTNVNVDVHFDQLRDVHMSYQRWATEKQKRLSAAVNWDANRDPSQKISVDVQLDNKGDWHHAGYMTVYYPGRLLNGEFEVLLKDWFCEWHVRMGWSTEDIILWKVKMYSVATKETVYALLSKMDTPFPGWKDTSFNLMWRYHDNLQAINGSMNWQEDYLSFGLLADYMLKTNEFYGEINAIVNSTIPTLPKAAAIARHKMVWKNSSDTLLSFQYNEDGMMMINSSWLFDRGEHENNVTGKVTLITPFPGYKSGFLRTKFVLGHKKDINGVTYLDLEDKVLKIYVNGHMRRITNCMLVMNVTHPITQFSHMSARLGLVEADRHLVAVVLTQASATGIEVRLKLNSAQDFHVFGHVALPIQYLTRAMVTAKRAKEEADFRVGWGPMDLGFTGIWHWQSPINFVYLYKLYTPLEGFEENGLVFKNIYGPGLDTELSVRLSTHKFGIAILLVDSGKGLIDVINDKFHQEQTSYDVLIEDFDTAAAVTIDTLYYPTVTASAHLIKYVGANEEDILQVNATLNLPEKTPIVLTDIFVLEQYTVMRNTLHLVTPFQAVKELKSVYTVDVILGEKFNITCVALLSNGTYWHEISYKVYYEYETGEDDAYQSYLSSLAIVTPLPMLPALDCTVSVRLEDSLWKMAADIEMPSFTVQAKGRLELDDPFVETSGSINLTSAVLDDYFIKMQFKKDFSEIENTIGGGLQVLQGDQNNYMFADVLWRPTPKHVKFKAKAALFPVLPPSDISIIYSDDTADGLRTITTDLNLGNESYYSMKADQRPSSVSLALSTPHKGFRAVKILGEFEEEDIRGSFVSDTVEYGITGKRLSKEPLELSLTLVPKGQGEPITIRVKSTTVDHKYSLSAHFVGPQTFTLHTNAEFEDSFTDLSLKVDMPEGKNQDIFFKARVDSLEGLRRAVSVQAATPLKRLSRLKGDTSFEFGPKTGFLLCNFDLPDMKGNGDLKWSFVLGDLFIKAIGHQDVQETVRSVDLDIYFGNGTDSEGLEKSDAGFRMDLDNVWQIGANATFGTFMNRRMKLVINAILPKPNVDVHTLYIDGDMGDQDQPVKSLDARYSTDVTRILTGLQGKVLIMPDSFNGNASIIWTSDSHVVSIDNRLQYAWDGNNSHYVDYGLCTPHDSFALNGNFIRDRVHDYQVVKGRMHHPNNTQIGEIDLRYGGIKHTDGHFNVTTPFKRLPWLKSVFDINNNDDNSKNKIFVNWPNKTASLNTTHNYLKQDTGFTQTGDISLSIPLNTQHLVTTNYYYVQGEQRSNGNATLDFDSERFVKASFNQILGKSERGLDLASTDIEVENKHTPVGIKYIHEYDATGNTDVKQATVVHLYNATKFNVTGKIDVFTFATGKNLKLTAMHGERTLTFENEYESVDKELKQGSKVKWAEDVWINYNIHVTNMTTDETESQQIDLNIWYPLRRFNLLALYKLRDNLLEGSGRMNWNVKDENKTAELKAKWENPPTADANLHNVQLLLSHPSFRKDVSLNGYYISTPEVMSNISLELQYSDYENEYLRLKSILTDNSNGPIRDYRFGLTCSHPATNLDLEMRSDINIHSKWYYFDNYYRFQKSLFFQKLRQAKILIDMNNSTVMYARSNETYFYNMTGRWDLSYPDYTVSGTVARPTGGDTAHAVLSVKDRALTAHYNSTDDISYHLVGMIVDTRSAKLDAWRDYDDVTTVDLASYIRLNHSRLLTSSVVWRPQIFGEVKAYTVNTLKHVYSQVNETLVIIKEVPMEAHTALKNIWGDARVRVREFLDDLNDLHVIKDDFDEFDRFLNESYMKNDFYVKDIVEFTYYVLDEMAIRNHLESLPGIVNDMWGMMGNTSQSIKQSLTYVVDTIKKAYANFLDSLNKFLEADFMELVSDKLEAAIMQYDTFVRDLHMKLLDYWESTWVNARNRLSKYWHELLKSMEPLFFKVVHYTESFVFTLWRGVMDFFYSRTQELTDSPYFNYVSTFGHEMDRIYKDLVNEDIITNIKKYSKKLWNVAWDKIQKYIPFKDELGQLYAEFSNACDNFMHTPPVMYVREKCTEAYVRLKWWYDYFMIGEALDKTWDIIYAKITDFAKTALQYEEIHRTPKTNFVFDPRKGEILLEQKLPMSWHAFNRTPDFTEIAEYKAVKDFMDQWLTSNKSIWSYYYDIRPYMDFNNVLPPFGGTAMITAQGTLVTFDKRVLTVTQTGTFVLCKDYKHDKLTVLMEVHKDKPFTLLLLTKGKLLSINMATEQVSIDSGPPLTLPTTIGDYLVDRAGGVVNVWSEGARVSCSLQPRTCQLRVPGWYFASVGGLLGTYNNELYDDLQIPNKGITTNVTEAVRSWDIGPPGLREAITRVPQNETQCHKFFVNNVSPLHPCTQRINATPFFLSCVSGVDACSLAAAYLQLCEQTHAPVHIPEICATCTTPEGDTIEEGSFYKLDHVPASTDVVFVIEAQFCNKNLRKNKNIDLFIEAFDSKLQSNGLSDNRYAIVGFGGRGVYKKPRSLYVNNRVFTDATQIAQHFDNFVIEKQDQTRTNNTARADMFAALSAAATLPFRAGVPKTLILMPCTRCDIRFMRLDYSTIYHNLLENSITLHILMDEDFMLSKKRAAKYLFGVDSRLAYTNKDYENLVGDAGLRKQVKLPKDKLGLCMSLAMESNGTIFTARKLAGDRATARRLSTVLGGRVDPRAAPQRCECRETALHCVQQPAMELSFWDSEDIEELIDMAMEPPTLPLP